MKIGVISDTHDLVRPEAVEALRGSELIIHAGDITTPGVLKELRALAPVVAVRGNNDAGAWAKKLKETAVVEAEGAKLYVIHDVKELEHDLTGFAAVIAGHSHRPRCEVKDGLLWLNPGSAGPRRWNLPVCVARLSVDRGRVEGEVVHLDVPPPKSRATAPRRRPRRPARS